MVDNIRDPEDVDISDAGDTVLDTLRQEQEKDSSENTDADSSDSAEDSEESEDKKEEGSEESESKDEDKESEDKEPKAEEPDEVKQLKKELKKSTDAVKRLQDGKYSPDVKALQDQIDKLSEKFTKKEVDEPREDDDDPVTKKEARLSNDEVVEKAKVAIREEMKAEKTRDQIVAAKAKYKEHYQPRLDLVDVVCKENPAYYEAILSAADPAEEAMKLAELHPEFRNLTKKVADSDKKLEDEGKEKPVISKEKVEKIVKNAQRPSTSAGVGGGTTRIVGGSDNFRKFKESDSKEDLSNLIEDVLAEPLAKMREMNDD